MAFWHWLVVAWLWLLEAKEIEMAASDLADEVADAQTPEHPEDDYNNNWRRMWHVQWSEEYQIRYYWNMATGESIWYPPWQCVNCGMFIPDGGFAITLRDPIRSGRACVDCACNAEMQNSESE